MIGDRIRQLRQNAGMTQAELARRLGISSSSVGMYEQNRREPSSDMLVKLGKIFDVSTDWLLSAHTGSSASRAAGPADGEDLAGLLDQWRENLMGQEGLMFNGQPLEEGDLEKIFDAMKLGAEIAASQNAGRKKGQHETGKGTGK